MRFFSYDDMLGLLPADSRVESLANEKAGALLSRYGQNPNRLPDLVRAGTLRTYQVNVEGKPSSVFWFRVEGERLIVDTLVSLGSGAAMQPALEQMEFLARSCGCSVLEGASSRVGMVSSLKNSGWYPAGMIMRKDLSHG